MKQFFKTVFASTLGVLIALAVVMIASFFFIIGITATMGGSSEYQPKENSVFKLSLNGEVVEQINENPFSELMGEENTQMALPTVIKAIRRAKNNEQIKGIYLEAGNLSTLYASAEAIRRELEDFKSSGKFIVSYGDNYTQNAYYICSVADSVFLNPLGSISLIGLSSQGLFYTGLAEKLGIEHYIFKVGTYKSAVEPFFLKKFSEANREQLTSFLNSIWGHMTSAIEKSRQISSEELNRFLNEGLAYGQATNMVEYKLADALCYRYEAENCVKKLAGQKLSEKLIAADVNKVASISVKEKESDDQIAVLYAEGEILESESPMSNASVITEDIAKELRKLQHDEDVKAVVLRVNSPGGSAYISEQIWKAVVDLKAVKPIVVSMSDYAASGGYYISCAANKIFAEHTTLTGSIGVFGVVRNLTGALEKIGLSTDMVKTNKYADLGDFSRPMREDEKALIQRSVEQTYDLFLTRCADGRGTTKAAIDSIGQGRVWTGEQALKIGLVDQLGGLDDAIKEAAVLANLTEYSIKETGGPKDFFSKLMEKQLEDMKISIVKSVIGEEQYKIYSAMKQAENQSGIIARMPYMIH